jgi:hypothetical protein
LKLAFQYEKLKREPTREAVAGSAGP